MIDRLQSSYQHLEERRASFLKEMQNLPAELLAASNENRWSILQIIAHLITAERLSVMYMQKKIQGIEDAGDTGLLGTCKNEFINH